MKEFTPDVGVAVAKNLREFGYPVDDEFVTRVCQELVNGEDPEAGVVAMFARDILRENGYLKEE